MTTTAKKAKLEADLSQNGGTIVENGTDKAVKKNKILQDRKKLIGQCCTLFFSDDPLLIVRGENQYLYDEHDHAYLDCISNVQHIGHGHPDVAEAVYDQMKLSNCNNRFLHQALTECAQAIVDTLPPDLDTCFMCNSGSEANDLALRIAKDFTGAEGVVVLDHAYHGHISSTIDLSPYKFHGPGGQGKPDHIEIAPVPDVYRGKFRLGEEELENTKKLAEMGVKYADEVKLAIDRLAKDGRKLAAFYMESLISCGGQIIPPPEYLRNVLSHVQDAGGLVVTDEVQSGCGRVGKTFWAFQLQGKDLCPDIVTMGKPMGNGFPVSAVVTKKSIADHFGKGMPYFNTFGGNPVSCAAVLTVFRVLKREKYQEKAVETGNYLIKKLKTLKSRHQCIGDVRGIGMFAGLELVCDPKTRSPNTKLASDVILELRKNHRILLSAEGPDGNILKFKPPMCFTKENVDDMIEKLDAVIGKIAM